MNGILTTVEGVAAGKHSDGIHVTVLGAIVDVEPRTTKQGNPWAQFRLLGATGNVPADLLPLHYTQYGHMLPAPGSHGALRMVTGEISRSEGPPHLIVKKIEVAP